MREYEKLEQLAAAINSASRIIRMINDEVTSKPRGDIKPDTAYIVGEVLRTISDHSAKRTDTSLGESASKAASYCDVYRKLKQQYKSSGNRSVDRKTVIDTMKAIHPVLKYNQQLFIDKIIRIHEIIES